MDEGAENGAEVGLLQGEDNLHEGFFVVVDNLVLVFG